MAYTEGSARSSGCCGLDQGKLDQNHLSLGPCLSEGSLTVNLAVSILPGPSLLLGQGIGKRAGEAQYRQRLFRSLVEFSLSF